MADRSFEYAEQLYSEGQVALAREEYENLLTVHPTLPALHFRLGVICADSGEHKQALTYYDNVGRLSPAYPLLQEHIGDSLFALGEWSRAIEHFQAAIDLNEGSAHVYDRLGVAYLQLKLCREALEALRLAVAKAPASAPILHHLGDAYFTLQAWDQAIAAYRSAISADPGHIWSHVNLGRAIVAGGKVEDAIEVLKGAIALDPRFAFAHFHLGEAYVEAGADFVDDAVDAYSAASELDPENAEFSERLALARGTQERVRKKKALRQPPRSGDFEGYLDEHTPESVRGWARNKRDPDRPVELEVYLDNRLFAKCLADSFRSDVRAQDRRFGSCGFQVRLPQFSDHQRAVEVAVRIAATGQHLGHSPRIVSIGPSGVSHGQLCGETMPSTPTPRMYRPPNAVSARDEHPLVSLIVLNRNGAALLRELFRSFAAHNSYPAFNFLIIDHASDDESLAVCEDWAERLPIEIVRRPGNFSFSQSNNFAVKLSSAPLLLFLNNDIVFCQDILPGLVKLMADETIAQVGVKLLDLPDQNGYSAPTIQHLGIRIALDEPAHFLDPYEIPYGAESSNYLFCSSYVPAVTAAVAICRRNEFLAVGGFDERYYYGYEDVDLSLKFQRILGKSAICASHLAAFHRGGTTRSKLPAVTQPKFSQNRDILTAEHGYEIVRSTERDYFDRPSFWQPSPLRVGFAVSSTDLSGAEGDLFTAFELGDRFAREFGWSVTYLSQQDDRWYDASALDVLIVMMHTFDLRRLRNASPGLRTVAWARSRFDVWRERPWFERFDCIWASSSLGAQALRTKAQRPVSVFPIATNWARFSAGTRNECFESDYCFTGSYWSSPREIVDFLHPERLPYSFALFGSHWENIGKFRPFWRGCIPYVDLPQVYASTKVVIDDATLVTKTWGSVNSRVFDAIAAGAVVITNGRAGSEALFDGQLPWFDSASSLESLLVELIESDEKRQQRVAVLQQIVKERHTYEVRAKQTFSALRKSFTESYRIGIKIGAPSLSDAQFWGDYHFARSLKAAFERLGHSARIDVLSEWSHARCRGDHINLVLRGLSRYEPRPGQLNVMWNISHPGLITRDEFEQYDAVFVASESFAESLAQQLSIPVHTLLQCTDPNLFYRDTSADSEPHELLFVGNSRRQLRPIVRDALTCKLPLSVYGREWDDLIPPELIRGEYIPNDRLRTAYSSAHVVLNDHWPDMREHGFLSNRLFDAAACGAAIVTDSIPGAREVFRGLVGEYDSAENLRERISAANKARGTLREELDRLSEYIRTEHTFDRRAEAILAVIGTLEANRLKPKPARTVIEQEKTPGPLDTAGAAFRQSDSRSYATFVSGSSR
ncbi:MAG: tetratricopeptide repeat protein [Bdellovibrionota bacterium]